MASEPICTDCPSPCPAGRRPADCTINNCSIMTPIEFLITNLSCSFHPDSPCLLSKTGKGAGFIELFYLKINLYLLQYNFDCRQRVDCRRKPSAHIHSSYRRHIGQTERQPRKGREISLHKPRKKKVHFFSLTPIFSSKNEGQTLKSGSFPNCF